MSRLKVFNRTREETQPVAEIATPHVAQHHILMEAVPVPVGTNEYDPNTARRQGEILKNFRIQAKDTFEPNECRCVTNAGQRLYQTTETYGTAMTVEQMLETMTEGDLTLRVNFRRPGIHSATTCMELEKSLLQKLIQESPDAKMQKTLELRVKAESHVAVPRHGAMFITVTEQGPVHLLSHIDYKIMTSYDQMYHSN